jgi:hypothetical protein
MFIADQKTIHTLPLSRDEVTIKQKLTIKCSLQTKKDAHTLSLSENEVNT